MLGGLLLCVLMLGSAAAAADPQLSPAEERGRQLYLTGSGVGSEAVIARFGPERIELPGEVATCGSCHGYDGRGRSESGIAASDITWASLSKPYGHVHPGGRVHPTLTPAGLKTLITAGRYPDGTPVDPAMPIYTLSMDDLDNLVAYLQRLGTLHDPGVGEERLRVGFLQLATPDPATGQALEGALRAYFARLNAAGGVYERRIELVAVTPPADSKQLGPWLMEQDLFALLTPFTPGQESLLAQAARHAEIPLIGPYTLFPPEGFEASRSSFYLFPGLAQQFHLAFLNITQTPTAAPPGTAILFGSDSRLAQAAHELQGKLATPGFKPESRSLPDNRPQLDTLIDTLRGQQVGLVLLLADSREGMGFLQAAAEQGWFPRIGLAGQLAGELLLQAPPAMRARLFLTLPTIASDRHPGSATAALLDSLAGVPARLPAQVAALAAAELFTEALRRAGQRLDRRGLVAALEKTYRFETGLTPPLSFSANRRIGSDGIYLIIPQADETTESPQKLRIEWVTPPVRH